MIDSTLLQYMDDLIICSSSLEQCHRDSIKVYAKLAQGGHKVSQIKIQYCQPQVEYLGRLIACGTRAIAPAQLKGISKAPLSQTEGQIMTFLGMTGFSADWIEDYAVKTGPLRENMKQAGLQHLSNPLKWNTDTLIAFETIKKELQQAPTLEMADYSKHFNLYVANRANGYASAVLMQATCSVRKETAYSLLQHKVE